MAFLYLLEIANFIVLYLLIVGGSASLNRTMPRPSDEMISVSDAALVVEPPHAG
jgi:hypothetical protein